MADKVLIAGAGPTGLVLALWLSRQGVGVRIIDKSAGPGETSRAMAVQARTLELYRQMDLGDAVVAAGNKNLAMNFWAGGRHRARLSCAPMSFHPSQGADNYDPLREIGWQPHIYGNAHPEQSLADLDRYARMLLESDVAHHHHL